MNAWLDGALAAAGFLLGQRCLLCDAASGMPVCDACALDLPALPPCCPRCAMPSPEGAVCGTCLAHPPAFDATFALWPYRFPVDRLIAAFKFHARLQLAPWFASALATRLPLEADALMALPLHRARLAERGFNQAHELARRMTQACGKPLLVRELVRQRATAEQARLPPPERAGNLRGAFTCRKRLDGLSLAVVDDVMTTGATLQESAVALKRAGAARVVNLVLARTLPQ